MFLTKSSSSFLLPLQYLVIISLLSTSCLTYTCVDFETLSNENSELAKKAFKMKDSDEGLIASGGFGSVYIFPSDPTKVVKIQTITAEYAAILDEIDITKNFSDRDTELTGNPRLAPTLNKIICVNMKNNIKFVLIISERFRGDLSSAVNKDPRFNLSMVNFSARMEFYEKMMASFGEISKLGYKHCDLKPENFLYKEYDANWAVDYSKGQEELSYFSVVTDFGLTVPWDQKCKGASPRYTDPQDRNNEMRFFDTDKAKVEIYSMALVIFYMETAHFTVETKKLKISKDFRSKLKSLSGYTNQIAKYIGNKEPLADIEITKVFDGLSRVHFNWNQKKIDYNHDLLKKDLEFIISGMTTYYEYMLEIQGADANQSKNLLTQYKKFTDTLITMVRKNNVTLNQRPSSIEVVQKFIQITTSSKEIEDTIGARRNLLLI